MLAPSGISASPFSNASANAASFRAVLYEWALMVFINTLPSGKASSSLLCPRSEIVFSLNMYLERYIYRRVRYAIACHTEDY